MAATILPPYRFLEYNCVGCRQVSVWWYISSMCLLFMSCTSWGRWELYAALYTHTGLYRSSSSAPPPTCSIVTLHPSPLPRSPWVLPVQTELITPHHLSDLTSVLPSPLPPHGVMWPLLDVEVTTSYPITMTALHSLYWWIISTLCVWSWLHIAPPWGGGAEHRGKGNCWYNMVTSCLEN